MPGKDLVVFQKEATPNPSALGDQQVLVHRLYLSLDPAMRGWMNDIPSYIPPVPLGAVMRGWTVCEVLASRSSKCQPGDWVLDNSLQGGWDEYAIVPAHKCSPLKQSNAAIPVTAHLGVLGITGLTAYFGLLEVGKPQPGDTVLVSAAAGATGSVVCQIAKRVVGCKVVGIAGGPAKCQWLLEQAGCDAVIDYKLAQGNAQHFQTQLQQALRQVHSKGFDIFFDNVGGMILNETLRRLAVKGRVVLCGAISSYNAKDPRRDVGVPPTNYMALIPLRAKIQGFLVTDHVRQFSHAKQTMARWIAQGKLHYLEDIRHGLEQAPHYLNELFQGGNTGKLIVQVGEPLVAKSSSSSSMVPQQSSKL